MSAGKDVHALLRACLNLGVTPKLRAQNGTLEGLWIKCVENRQSLVFMSNDGSKEIRKDLSVLWYEKRSQFMNMQLWYYYFPNAGFGISCLILTPVLVIIMTNT